jgi:hypothetical protein
MLAVLVAALLTAAGIPDTVVTTDGARIQGMVVEESAAGVTIQMGDGSLRRFERGQVARIEFADGSVSTWPAPAAPAPAAAPPPAPTPATQAAHPPPQGPFDTVFFLGGGRVRGTVLEESPSNGVSVRLLDGNVRRYSRDEIVRIEYADGSVSRRREAPPPPRPVSAPPAQPPPPPPTLPAQPPAYQPKGAPAPIVPVYAAVGIGGTFFGGESFDGRDMNDDFNPQAHLSLEGGLRLSPAIAFGVYMDGGAGDVSSDVRDYCDAGLVTCTGVSGRFGFLLRHTWDHSTPTAKWLSIGTGWEVASVTNDNDANTEVFTYTGREYVRLGGGIDFRSNGVLGVGLYGSFSWGEYDEIDETRFGMPADLPSQVHTTAQFGVRLTLFP